MKKPSLERFFEKVNKTESCWIWTGGKTHDGYGTFWTGASMTSAARFIYEVSLGPLDSGMEPDHLCKNRICVRPSHLEAVTHKVNTLRGNTIVVHFSNRTHCQRGHSFAIYGSKRSDGGRRCRLCRRQDYAAQQREYSPEEIRNVQD